MERGQFAGLRRQNRKDVLERAVKKGKKRKKQAFIAVLVRKRNREKENKSKRDGVLEREIELWKKKREIER